MVCLSALVLSVFWSVCLSVCLFGLSVCLACLFLLCKLYVLSIGSNSFYLDVCSRIKCHQFASCVNHLNGSASCACPLKCPLKYDPVCGTDGETHVNTCLLKLKSCQDNSDMSVAYSGECRKSICNAH